MSEALLTTVVRKRELQGRNVVVLELADKSGEALPAFEPGAHVEVHLNNGLVRQYSLCGDPADHHCYRLGILNDPQSRGGSRAVFESVMTGSELTISVPRNLFPLDPGGNRHILIGGGIGITPMIAMARALFAQGKTFELWYCGHERAASAFVNELANAPFSGVVNFYFTAEHAGNRLNFTSIMQGYDENTHVYVCGPQGFMESVITAAEQCGYPASHLHKEFFGADVETGGETFEVVAQRSGITVQVLENQTIAEALKAAGVKVQVACKQGACGTCLCDVLEGTPDHRDVYLTDEEKQDNDQITLCCSRAKSERLVLDI